MQTPEQRDEKTLAIASALGIFVVVLTAGAMVLWAGNVWLELSEARTGALAGVVFLAAALSLIVTLVRAQARMSSTRRETSPWHNDA